MALRVRKNQADLSDDEKSRFTAAILKMKSTGVYDRFIVIHQASMAMPHGDTNPAHMNMWAHRRPGFLPWHRQLILDFENELRAADSSLHGGAASNLTLPYWDWVHYRTRKHFIWWWGQIWGDDFMGGNCDSRKHQAVTNGAFRAPLPNSDGSWKLFYTPNKGGALQLDMDPPGPDFLQRNLGADIPSGELPTQKEWDAAKVITVYDSKPWDETVGANTSQPGFIGVDSFRNVFEGFVRFDPARDEPELHNKVHMWVGGSMEPISSPNDPIFFLHHCNVDRLWAYWQLRNPQVPYLPDGSTPDLTGPEGHNLNDAMHPWDGVARAFTLPSGGTLNLSLPTIKIRDVLNHNSLGYRYDSDPPALSSKP